MASIIHQLMAASRTIGNSYYLVHSLCILKIFRCPKLRREDSVRKVWLIDLYEPETFQKETLLHLITKTILRQ